MGAGNRFRNPELEQKTAAIQAEFTRLLNEMNASPVRTKVVINDEPLEELGND